MPKEETAKEPQFSDKVPNKATNAIETIKAQYSDPATLDSLTSELCRKLNIANPRASNDPAPTTDAAVAKVRNETKGLIEEPAKKDEAKFGTVLWIIDILKSLTEDHADGGDTRTIMGGNVYVTHFHSLFAALSELGLTLSDVIQCDFDQSQLDELDEIVFQSYANGMMQMAIEDESRKSSVGIYHPGNARQLPKIEMANVVGGHSGPRVNAFLDLTMIMDRDTRLQQYVHKSELYMKAVKLHLANSFKYILASNCQVGYNNPEQTPRIIKLNGTWENSDLMGWLRELHKYGLRPKDVLGFELDEFFEITDRSGYTPSPNYRDSQRELFEILQDIDDPNVDLKEKYPDIAHGLPGSPTIESCIVGNFCKKHGLHPNINLLTRNVVDPRELLEVKSEEEVA